MPKRFSGSQRKAKSRARAVDPTGIDIMSAASRGQRFRSFEPDINVPVLKIENVDDENDDALAPLNDEQRASQERTIEARANMLQNKESLDWNSRSFVEGSGGTRTAATEQEMEARHGKEKTSANGNDRVSTIDYIFQLAKEAERDNVSAMSKNEFMIYHEKKFAEHHAFASKVYKTFRRVIEDENAVRDPDYVKLLLVGRLRETGRFRNETIDRLASVLTTREKMYKAMRADVEARRNNNNDNNNNNNNNNNNVNSSTTTTTTNNNDNDNNSEILLATPSAVCGAAETENNNPGKDDVKK